MNEADYKNYVEQAKKQLKIIEGHQAKIAAMAVKICTIRHGGYSKGFYTIKQFAEDIGMNEKTLQNWVQVYRNVIEKLDDPNPNWKLASRVNNILKEERVIENAIVGKKKSRFAYKQDIPAEKIKRLYEGEKPFEREFANLCETARTTDSGLTGDLNNIPLDKFHRMESNAKNANTLLGKRDLGIISDDRLMYLMTILDSASDKINDYLTNKKIKKYA